MHFAANALVGESMENPSKYFRNNIAAGLNLLDAMVAADVKRLVFSSTCATFGPPERVPIDEDAAAASDQSVRRIETGVRENSEAGTTPSTGFVSFRFVISTPPARRKNSEKITAAKRILIPNVLKVALGTKTHVEIFGTDYDTPDGTCIRDYIHIIDLARCAHPRARRRQRAHFITSALAAARACAK